MHSLALPAEPDAVASKLEHLRRVLRALDSVIVCFSGGIDSALLLAVAHAELGPRALGLTAVSASLAPGEKEEAAAVAVALGAAHVFVASGEVDDPNYAANGTNRCFYCKTELYSLAVREAKQRGFQHVVSGIITEDLGDFRPGIDAARRHHVRFPLVEAGFHKEDVRAAAVTLRISIWDKPAAACLSSRLPYGVSVTRERLSKIGGLEAELKRLGFRQLRVRYHEMSGPTGEATTLARLELGVEEIPRAVEPGVREALVKAARDHGFHYVTLDLLGYRMGSHNEVLRRTSLPVIAERSKR